MTPNLISTNTYYYETLNNSKNEPLDLTLRQKLRDEHISKSGKSLSVEESDQKPDFKACGTSSSKSKAISQDPAFKSLAKKNPKKKQCSLAKKWIKTHLRISRDAALSFYTIFMMYTQFCHDNNEFPVPTLELLHLLQFEFIQNDSSVEDAVLDEKDNEQKVSAFQELSLYDEGPKNSIVDEENKPISFENLKFRCVFHEIQDEYTSDSSDSAVSSLGSEHEATQYRDGKFETCSGKDSSYESLDESSDESATSALKIFQETPSADLKANNGNTLYVLCISSPDHVNKGIKIKCEDESQSEIQIIRVSPKDSLKIKKGLQDSEFAELERDSKELQFPRKNQLTEDAPRDAERNERELENDTERQNDGEELKLQNKDQEFPDVPKGTIRIKRELETDIESVPSEQENDIKEIRHAKKIKWSKSQEMVIEGVAQLLNLKGFEGSPCYKDAKGFANTLIEMLRKKELKLFLAVFAHAMSCTEKHEKLCFMFKRILNHITRAQHNCAVKFVYGHVLRLHLDTCGSDNCGFSECKSLRQLRKMTMSSATPKK